MATIKILKDKMIAEVNLDNWCENVVHDEGWDIYRDACHKDIHDFKCPSYIHARNLEKYCDDNDIPCYYVCETFITVSGSYEALYMHELGR